MRFSVRTRLSVYKKEDLQGILADITTLGFIWFDLVGYLQLSATADTQKRAEAYRQLCDQPRIAQELEKLRREKTPLAQP